MNKVLQPRGLTNANLTQQDNPVGLDLRLSSHEVVKPIAVCKINNYNKSKQKL